MPTHVVPSKGTVVIEEPSPVSPYVRSGDGTPRQPPDPPFLYERVEDYYERQLRQAYGGRHPLKGRAPGPDAVRMRSNDYLCLAGDQRIIDAEIAVLAATGHGDSVSRSWTHHQKDRLRAFEERMAALTEAEDAVLCSSGYTANIGLIQTMAEASTPVYLDMKAHMSLWEGVRSARAVGHPFRHNEPDSLGRLIEREGPGLVIVDALYSQDGALCRIADFVEVAERYGCALVVDETHSFGTHGKDGAGLVAACGLAERVHFRTVGLSKAVASRGGVVLCSRRNAEYFRYQSFPVIFSTSVLPHEVAGYDAVLDILAAEPWRRERLHANHATLRRGLLELGYAVEGSESQIISLEPGEPKALVVLRDALESRGVFGSPFCPPATPDRRCLVRFTVNCGLGPDEIEHVLRVCRDIRDEVGMRQWRSTLRRARGSSGEREEQARPERPKSMPAPSEQRANGVQI
jgi:CAI-1 autoinducer synthase